MIFLKKPVFFTFGVVNPPRAPPLLESVSVHVFPRGRVKLAGSLLNFGRLVSSTAIDSAFCFRLARLPALVAENPPALMPLMMLALVIAVDPVLLVLVDRCELAFVVTVSILDSGREDRSILAGLMVLGLRS